MSDRQSPRFAAHALFPFSSSAILDTVYSGRELNGRPEKVAQRAHRAPVSDAIWGQFNNYRSNGLAGSAIVHIALLRLILSAATFGHPVVKQVQQYQTVTLIAPSPDSYALPDFGSIELNEAAVRHCELRNRRRIRVFLSPAYSICRN